MRSVVQFHPRPPDKFKIVTNGEEKMILVLSPSDLLPRNRGKSTQNIKPEDFIQNVSRVIRYCEFCVYQEKEGSEMKVLKSRY